MRYALIALLILCSPIWTSAQKHSIFADAGLSSASLAPGFSATYNYKIFKFIGVGAGTQFYNFYPTIVDVNEYVPAISANVLINIWPRKKNQFFMFWDQGRAFYKKRYDQPDPYNDSLRYTDLHGHGTYIGLGIGYFHRITKYGGGVYGSLKIIANNYKAIQYNIYTHQQTTIQTSGSALVASLGFRFAYGKDRYETPFYADRQKEKKQKTKPSGSTTNTAFKNYNIFADASLPIASAFPGFSATYCYNVTRHFSAGAGLQGYKYYPLSASNKQFIPTLYADVRITAWATKRNQFFTFLDLGYSFYKKDKSYHRDRTSVYYYPHNNSFYSGLGLGYFHRITKTGNGVYLSVKMVGTWYTIKDYSLISEQQNTRLYGVDAVPAVSIGYKF